MAKTKGKSQKGKAPARAPATQVAKRAHSAKAAKPAPAKTAARPAAAKLAAAKTAAKPAAAKTAAKPAAAKTAAKPAAAKTAANAAAKTTRAKPSLRPSLPLPPPPPAPPPERDELPAPRDIARLTRYGERFGAHKIDVRWLPLQLPVTGNALAVFDPAVPKSWRVFDRPVGTGQYRAMLSIARGDDGKERLAAITIHVGRPPIARWTVAHFKGQKKPKSADQLPGAAITSGWLALVDERGDSPGVVTVTPSSLPGVQPVDVSLTDGRRALALPSGNGEYVAYWAVDEVDKPIALVVDFDVFTQKEWKARPPQ